MYTDSMAANAACAAIAAPSEPEFSSRNSGYASTANASVPAISSGRRPIRSDSAASGRISTIATRHATVIETNALVLEKCRVLMK